MKYMSHLPRRARWAAPAAIIAAAGGVLAAPGTGGAAPAPRLPARSAAQLLAAVTGNAQPPPLSGTITETASLGLPALPAGTLGAPASGPSLLAGSHTFGVWYSDPGHYRISLPQNMSEDDLVRNGASAWLWDSSANTVTRLTLPAAAPMPPVPAVPLTPQQAASQALAATGQTTTVRVDPHVTVAGQAAYQLVLAPKTPGSLIGQVRIAIDSAHFVPLRVQVFAKGAATPSAETGFTAVSFTRPPTSDYRFRPPAGARIVTQHLGSAVPAGTGGPGPAITGDVRVIGTGWLTVASLPVSDLASVMSAGPAGGAGMPFRYSSASAAPGTASSRPNASGQAPGAGSLLGGLLRSARQVSGPWGSGRLLRASLLSVLVSSNGRVLLGAVTPSVLYRDATQAGHVPAGLWRHTASRAGHR